TLGTTVPAARQLASSARRAVSDGDVPHRSDHAEQQRVLSAFLAAAHLGDIDGLLRVLAPDVVVVGDGGGVAAAARSPITGPLRVARFLANLFRRSHDVAVTVEPVLVN